MLVSALGRQAAISGGKKLVRQWSARFDFTILLQEPARAPPAFARCVMVILETPQKPSLPPVRLVAARACLAATQLARASSFQLGPSLAGSAAPRWPPRARHALEPPRTAPSRTLAAPRAQPSGLRYLSRSNGTHAPLSRSAGAPATTSAVPRGATHATMAPVPRRPHAATYQRRAPPRYRDAPSQTHPRQPWPPSSPASRT